MDESALRRAPLRGGQFSAKSRYNKHIPMIDILNLALPYFGLIFIGYACGKYKKLPEAGLEWMNFFLLYVSLPALFFRTLARTPFEQLNNPPFVIATTLAPTVTCRRSTCGVACSVQAGW